MSSTAQELIALVIALVALFGLIRHWAQQARRILSQNGAQQGGGCGGCGSCASKPQQATRRSVEFLGRIGRGTP